MIINNMNKNNKVGKFNVNILQPFINGTVYYQCIPYNEETKHLIGTTEDCPEYYKWWEE